MKIKKIYFLFLITFNLIFALKIEAAILDLESSSRQYYLNDIFLVHLKIDTENERINAAQAELTFPNDKLEVIEISQGDSIFTLWPEEPSFSNQEGKFSFVGGVPLGFEGKGNIITIVFKVIFNENERNFAEINFTENCQVLLNDGLGTQAKLEKKKAIFTLFPKLKEISKNEWIEELKKDNIPPEPFEIVLDKNPLIFEGKYYIAFQTIDFQSGIDHYEIKEGKKAWKKIKNLYLLEDQSLNSKVLVKAIDKAGNERIVIFKLS